MGICPPYETNPAREAFEYILNYIFISMDNRVHRRAPGL